MTRCGALGANSRELARSRPAALRANSMTMTWSPRHRPRQGISLLPGVTDGGDHAFDAPFAEATGHDHAVEVAQAALDQQALHLLGLDPVQLDVGAVGVTAVAEGLDDRKVGVGEVHVLADQTDAHRLGGGLDPAAPAPASGRGRDGAGRHR